jgi:anti-anti-sigma regulatory factor
MCEEICPHRGGFQNPGGRYTQTNAHVVVLDLTDMHAIGGGDLGTLLLLQKWAQDHDIRFKLFNPSRLVLDKLKHVDFEVVRTA